MGGTAAAADAAGAAGAAGAEDAEDAQPAPRDTGRQDHRSVASPPRRGHPQSAHTPLAGQPAELRKQKFKTEFTIDPKSITAAPLQPSSCQP